MDVEFPRLAWAGLVLMLSTVPTPAQLRPGDPGSAGMSRERLEQVSRLLDSEVNQRGLCAASILVARRGTIVLHQGFGHLSPQAGAPAVQPDSIYVVGSITKTFTATAMMMLVERGQVSLAEPVFKYLPEFTGGDRNKVRVLDLLAHTSGLPDQLPENTALRRAHAPLSEFLKRTFTTPLLFTPGTQYSYQSMGILLAGVIIERLTKTPLGDFERKEIFEPLGMAHSSLGLGNRPMSEVVQVQETGDPKELASWGVNSDYWRHIGNSWGGMHTTTMDLAIMLQTFLDGGSYSGKRILSPVTVKAMISDQNARLNGSWGLGWRLGRSLGTEFGDLVSPRAFGHPGSPGTVEWADPETGLICVILTSRPLEVDNSLFLRLVSNAVAASVEH